MRIGCHGHASVPARRDAVFLRVFHMPTASVGMAPASLRINNGPAREAHGGLLALHSMLPPGGAKHSILWDDRRTPPKYATSLSRVRAIAKLRVNCILTKGSHAAENERSVEAERQAVASLPREQPRPAEGSAWRTFWLDVLPIFCGGWRFSCRRLMGRRSSRSCCTPSGLSSVGPVFSTREHRRNLQRSAR